MVENLAMFFWYSIILLGYFAVALFAVAVFIIITAYAWKWLNKYLEIKNLKERGKEHEEDLHGGSNGFQRKKSGSQRK